MHIDDDWERSVAGREIEVALKLAAIVVGVDDISADFDVLFAGVRHVRSPRFAAPNFLGLGGFPII